MAKPEWGVKRICQSCATKFYDLKRSPITCPKCAATFDPEALLKSRRSRPAPSAKAVKPEPVAAAAEVAAEKPVKADAEPGGDGGDGGEAANQPADDGDDSVLQDTSELGDDGVSEVVVTSKDEDN